MTGVIKWLGSDKLSDLMDGVFGSLDNIFPNATTADYCDLISWVMSNGLPSDIGGLLEGKLPSDLVPWLSGVLNPERNQSPTRTRTLTIISTISSTRNGTAAHKSPRA